MKQNLLEILKPKVHKCNFIFKFPVDCDDMMHVLKDSINLKYSELLTKVISKCNQSHLKANYSRRNFT